MNIATIISKYIQEKKIITNGNVELEVRFQHVTKQLYRDMFDRATKLPNVKQSQRFTMNVINDNYIKEITFDSVTLEKIKTNFYRKKSLLLAPLHVNDGRYPYIVALNAETPCSEITANETSFIRIKNRAQIFMKSSDECEWEVDFTRVLSIRGSELETVGVLKDFLRAFYLKGDNKDFPMTYEIEIEHVGGVASEEGLREIIQNIAGQDDSKDLQFQSEIYRIAGILEYPPKMMYKFKSTYGLKQLLPQAMTLIKTEYRKIYPPVGWFVTLKADGKRGLLCINGAQTFILSEDKCTHVQMSTFPTVNVILDGEIIDNCFYAFDIIHMNNKNIYKKPFLERVPFMSNACDVLSVICVSHKIFMKPYYFIDKPLPNTIKDIIKKVWDEAVLPKDGIIFTSSDKSYLETENYKWKPHDMNTIDFLVKKSPVNTNDLWLFVSINLAMYQKFDLTMCEKYDVIFPTFDQNMSKFPIQFSPITKSDAYIWRGAARQHENIHDHICELAYKDGDWELVRVRDDREKFMLLNEYFGNDYRTADNTWINIIDKFPVEELYNGSGEDYFATSTHDNYRAVIYITSALKENIMKYITPKAIVADIGIGRGQDLHRYSALDIAQLYAIDKDATAISELMRRRYNVKTERLYKINVEILDINATNYKDLSGRMGVKSVNTVVCNLACHYFMQTEELAANFCQIIGRLARESILLTVVDGRTIYNLLSENKIAQGESWEYHDGTILKYKIKRLYASDEFTAAGQKIGFKLPFTTELVEEYLVNIDFITSQLAELGWVLTEEKSALEFMESYSKILTNEDKKYLSLYKGLVYTL